MVRITKRVFTDLAIFMMGFGLLIGLFFPFFLDLLGVPPSLSMAPWFFLVCMAAGLVVGLVNILLARGVVGARISELAGRMRYISGHLIQDEPEEIIQHCKPDQCLIPVDSEDLIGESASAYNILVQSLFSSIKSEIMVRRFSSMLSLSLELDDLARTVLFSVLENSGTEGGAIIIERDGVLFVVASHRLSSAQDLCESDLVAEALKSRARKLVDLPAGMVVRSALVDFTPRQVCVEPLVYHDVALGALVLAGAKPIQGASLHFLELVNSSMAVAFRNALTYDQLQKLAANDSLTGMFNRRFGMARLQEEYGRAIRSGSPIGVCIFDLDHFKNVNDTYGHPVGDKVIVHVSKLIRSALREGDLALRYGGEEFLIVLPGASITDTYQIAEKVRRLVEETVFQFGSQNLRLSISGGGASWPDFNAASSEALVKKADEALYRAKEGGRNRIFAL
ncbi:MAG TPA: GGDEF domain-containing protein [Rectinemataceae bacterium]